ncbi:MAG: DUF1501 domain-containing protein [Planctomycetota bacterium]|nr:DUF1501 domain-containing protein [Planctomycetota bacterium]MSR39824.1 DUF1501 domain-containing protein [Planctomycetota bacterium]
MAEHSRRTFLKQSTLYGIGCSVLGAAPLRPRPRTARADTVIQIHLAGGLSHLDTFDPKPESPIEVRGPFGVIKSKLDGDLLSALLPRTANISDKITIVRSMTHGEADHDRGAHSVLTGYQPSPAIIYPSFGAVVAHELGGQNQLPPYVCVPTVNSSFLGTGYLGAAFAPFAIGGNPATARFRVRDLLPPQEIDELRRDRRKQLLHDLDQSHPDLQAADTVVASEAFYQQAFALLESKAARTAFDLAAEPDAKKDRYGRHSLGMSCLLARRLSQSGVRYVVATHNGFDHHSRISNDLPPRMNEVDQAFAALIADLDAEGLLDRTLVLLTTEFGRTPRQNGDGGRDHWSRAFSVVLAGAGVKRGHVHGSTNAAGAEPETDPVQPADLAATVFSQLGLDPAKKLMAPGDRPIDLVRDGAVIDGVLA